MPNTDRRNWFFNSWIFIWRWGYRCRLKKFQSYIRRLRVQGIIRSSTWTYDIKYSAILNWGNNTLQKLKKQHKSCHLKNRWQDGVSTVIDGEASCYLTNYRKIFYQYVFSKQFKIYKLFWNSFFRMCRFSIHRYF